MTQSSPPPASKTPPVEEPAKPKSPLPVPVLVGGGIAVVAIVVWYFSIEKDDPMNECIEIIYKEKGVTATKNQLELDSESAKLGKLDLTATDDAAIEYKKSVPPEIQLATLEACRAKHAGTPNSGIEGSGKPMKVEFNARVSTQVTHGSRKTAQSGVAISSPNPAIGKCTTHDGNCDLPVRELKSTDTVDLNANFDGITTKTVTVAELLRGVTFEIPGKLPEVIVSVKDCNGSRLEGEVRFDGENIYRKDCSDPTSSECRRAPLRGGEAVFRYDAAAFKPMTLIYDPPQGNDSTYPVTALRGEFRVKYPPDCDSTNGSAGTGGGTTTGGGSGARCDAETTLKVQNEARRVAVEGPVTVSFTIANNTVSVSGAPADVVRQLNGKRLGAANCTGRFRLP